MEGGKHTDTIRSCIFKSIHRSCEQLSPDLAKEEGLFEQRRPQEPLEVELDINRFLPRPPWNAEINPRMHREVGSTKYEV